MRYMRYGETIPSKRVTATLPGGLVAALETEARAEGCSVAELVRVCIDRELPRLKERRRKRRKPERKAA